MEYVRLEGSRLTLVNWIEVHYDSLNWLTTIRSMMNRT